MKYLSLFSGVGGFELGIQQAYESNNEHAHQCKKSKPKKRTSGRKRTTNKHRVQLHDRDGSAPLCIGYSEIDKYACQIYNKHFNHKNYGDITKINPTDLPEFDLLVGGFPCQAFSIAGKRAGFADTRGTLFFEIARIIREKQPRLLLLENVRGLLSHDQGRTFSTIISTLDELGYDLQWQVLNSKNFGVPQNRERVFIVGHLRGTSRPQVFPITRGNKTTLKQIIAGGQGNRVYNINGISCTQASLAGGRGAKTGLYLTSRPQGIRRLTPTECERLQGFPDGWTEKGMNYCECAGKETPHFGVVNISDTQRYKTLGNAVTVNVIKEIMLKLL